MKGNDLVKNVLLVGLLILLVSIIVWVLIKKFTPSSDVSVSAVSAQEVCMEQLRLSSDVYNTVIDRMVITGNYPVLVFRYSMTACHACMMADLHRLRQFQQKTGKQHVLILPAYPDNRSSRIQLKSELADFNYKRISADSLVIPKDEKNGFRSYFALITEDGKMEMVFFPRRDFPKLTNAYFQEIEKRITSK